MAIAIAKNDTVVKFEINPTKAEVCYGYIENKEDEILSPREKPVRETAVHFIEKEDFLWNSGMFFFKAGNFLGE